MAAIIKNGNVVGGGGSTEIKTITYEEYLANKELYDASDDVYAIPDYPYSNGKASDIFFDDTNVQLGEDDVQGAIENTSTTAKAGAPRTKIFSANVTKSGGTGTVDITDLLANGTYLISAHTGNSSWRYAGILFKTGSGNPVLVDLATNTGYLTVTCGTDKIITITNNNATYDTVVHLTAVKINV